MPGAIRKAALCDQVVASVLTVAILGYGAPATLAATTRPQLAEIRGNVLAADGLTAVTGVTVKAANMKTLQIYASSPTGENGTYTLAGLPAGEYDLAVETPQGLYAANLLVDANAGKRTVVSLALKPDVQQGRQGEPPKGDEKKTDEGKKEEPPPPPPEPQPQKKKKKGGGFWRSPGGAAIAIVVGAALVGAAANGAAGNDNNEKSMSAH